MKLKETQILAITNLKGGVSKTTTTANVGSGLARMGYKVLMVDWDPQYNLTLHFGFGEDHGQPTLFDALDTSQSKYFDPKKLQPIPLNQYPDRLFILPSSFKLSMFESMFSDNTLLGSQFVLQNVLNEYVDIMDFIIIDCQPSLSLLTLNAYLASDYLFIPMEVGLFDIIGYKQIVNTLERLRDQAPNIGGVFLSRLHPRTVIAKDYQTELSANADVPFMQAHVRNNVNLSEAKEGGTDIFNYDNELNEGNKGKSHISYGAEDYYNVINEILFKIGVNKEIITARNPVSNVNGKSGSNESSSRKRKPGFTKVFKEFTAKQN